MKRQLHEIEMSLEGASEEVSGYRRAWSGATYREQEAQQPRAARAGR